MIMIKAFSWILRLQNPQINHRSMHLLLMAILIVLLCLLYMKQIIVSTLDTEGSKPPYNSKQSVFGQLGPCSPWNVWQKYN